MFRGRMADGELVAVKTVKGEQFCNGYIYIKVVFLCSALSSEGDKLKLLKEVSLMLSFKHENVMSLIGLCFDGDVPMIIMPFMSDGSVLNYVRQNREHLFLTAESLLEEVALVCVYTFPS